MVLVLGGATLAFSACGGPKEAKIFNKVTDLYGFAGATTAAMLDQMTSPETSANALTQDEEAKIGEINKHMNMLEGFVGGKKPVNVTKAENVEIEGYAQKLKIEVDSIKGKSTIYMYYNETRLDNEEIDIDDSDDEEEIESKLSGIIVVGDQQFEMKGTKEVEGDEIELEFEARIENGNYVKFKQETETGEQEFSYELRDVNDVLLDKVEFELEIENGEIEIEYKLLDSNNQIQKYKMEKETENGVDKIKISYTVDGKKTSVKLTIETVENITYYVYNINNGESIIRFEEGATTPTPEVPVA